MGRRGGYLPANATLIPESWDEGIDTCCINKQSDAELSAAINSMYRWYQSASLCYLYLFDVHRNKELRTHSGKVSQLFDRAWTLQELLAPRHVSIFDHNWTLSGTKETPGPAISRITNIDESVLGGESLSNRSIAQRMSWASGRKSTRIEDRAYSLLGIFGVYMPTLYGEGENAFLRLQQQIISVSDDHSIFAWPIQTIDQPGLLAPNPDVFSDCKHIISRSTRRDRSPYSMTNRDLAIKLIAVPHSVDLYLARLNCSDQEDAVVYGTSSHDYMGIFLRRLYEEDQYARVKHDGATFFHGQAHLWEQQSNKKVAFLEFYVAQQYSNLIHDRKDRVNGFRIMTREILSQTRLHDRFSVGGPCEFDFESGIMTANPNTVGTTGWLDIRGQQRKLEFTKLGFDIQYNPVCFLATSNGMKNQSTGIGSFDKTGKFTYSTRNTDQYTDEERAQWPGFHLRDAFDGLAWNEIQGRYAKPFLQHDGLWALKGDRLDGLCVDVVGIGTVRIVRGEWEGKLVWEVHLENLLDRKAPGLMYPVIPYPDEFAGILPALRLN